VEESLARCAVALALLVGCEDRLVGEAEPFSSACSREPPLTYENFGEGTLDRHCLSCHSEYVRLEQRGGATLGVDFNDWSDVVHWSDRILVRAVEEDTMPPTGTMTPLERDQLGEWLYCEVFPAAARGTLEGEAEAEGEGQ
jgi:cytochrome c5